MASIPEASEPRLAPHVAHHLADSQPVDPAPAAWAELSPRLAPLLLGGRLDNLVDILALMADLVDFLDPAMIEKVSSVFEEGVAAHGALSGALRLAAAQTRRDTEPPGTRALWALARDADTRRGLALLLRTLQIVGRAQRPMA
ncbi:hypothetical protein D9X30_4958 [Cupriavidus sp. U2]|uniref:DUF1641 domain-containing protein n=1 Tax=Cupriavidus sp. U2 TaxID=2920269 RepID=UPI00129DEC9F|nr:DUF1641 domain-containing protein [Cupriavidus sp. U2]KAI3589375.1 hypothetical protein D9X30_4958 [Cupriavidus sp. U2]